MREPRRPSLEFEELMITKDEVLPTITPDDFHNLMFRYSRLGLADSQRAFDMMVSLMATTLSQRGFSEGINVYKEFCTTSRKDFVKGVLLHGD